MVIVKLNSTPTIPGGETENALYKISNAIAKAKAEKIVIVVGAGISCSSGIPVCT
jgi:ATP-dependent protease ClpP protease subunit